MNNQRRGGAEQIVVPKYEVLKRMAFRACPIQRVVDDLNWPLGDVTTIEKPNRRPARQNVEKRQEDQHGNDREDQWST